MGGRFEFVTLRLRHQAVDHLTTAIWFSSDYINKTRNEQFLCVKEPHSYVSSGNREIKVTNITCEEFWLVLLETHVRVHAKYYSTKVSPKFRILLNYG